MAIALTAAGLVTAVAAGTLLWAPWSGSPDLLPVDQALVNLASAPGLQYRESLAGGITEDIQVTGGGEALGTTTIAGEQGTVLVAGGTTYVQSSGEWVTGVSGVSASALADSAPAGLALTLLDDIQHGTVTVSTAGVVDGVESLRVHSQAGELYISKDKPYRVVSYVRGGVVPSQPALISLRSRPVLPFQAVDTALVVDETSDAGSIDITPLSLSQASQAYDGIEADTAQLATSMNVGVGFSVQGSARVQCSADGCTVGATVSDSYIGSAATQVTGGRVAAIMTGSVTINGLAGGSCTATATFPVNGTGSVSCYDPGAGAVWANAEATARAEASANGATSYQVLSTAQVSVYARGSVQAQISKLITHEQEDQQYDTCQPRATSTSVYAPDAGLTVIGAVHPAGAPDNCGRFVTNGEGETIDLADPAVIGYVRPADKGKGTICEIDPAKMGLNPNATRVRIMYPTTSGKFQYPNGRLTYMNSADKEVNPITGRRIITKTDPLWHIPLP